MQPATCGAGDFFRIEPDSRGSSLLFQLTGLNQRSRKSSASVIELRAAPCHSSLCGGRVRRETGRRYEVKVLSGEGVANHTAPESCAATREGRSEALTGDSAGQPLSGENQLRSADAFRPAEGNTAYVVIARHRSAPRRRRHWHALTPPGREPGYLWTVLAEFCRDRAGKAGGRSRR